jgi:5'-nucleotidase
LRWTVPLALAAAVGAVLVATLASPRQASADVVIAGARSISDPVSIAYGANKTGSTTDVHVLAFNDLHGNLEAATNNIYGHFAGGAAYLAKAVKDKQAMYGGQEATVFAGDNIGASPLANGLFFEEPITVATNLMNVDFASVGNHEFDKGAAELLRIQNGGCRPVEGCTAAPYALPNGGTTNVYPGADFQYLAANVVVDATGKTLFPPYATKTFRTDHGNKKLEVGFIGEVLQETPTIVTPTGVAGLTFEDEADAANAVVHDQAAKHVGAWVLVIHQGGQQAGAPSLNGARATSRAATSTRSPSGSIRGSR